MVGHSTWLKVKHIKGLLDGGCSVAHGKLVKEITVTARQGGELSGNPRRCFVVQTARVAKGLQQDTGIAIGQSIGEPIGPHDKQTIYRGNSADWIAWPMTVATDYKNRTATSQRFILSKYPGIPATCGSVSYPSRSKDRPMTLYLLAGRNDFTSPTPAVRAWNGTDLLDVLGAATAKYIAA